MLGNTFETVRDDAEEVIKHTKDMIKSTKNGFKCLIFGHQEFDCFEIPFCVSCYANFPFTEEMKQAQSDEEFYSACAVFKRSYKKYAWK